MTLSWNTLSSDAYAALRFQVIQNAEGFKQRIYIDSNGFPSIGIGFNLSATNVFNAVVAALGIPSAAVSQLQAAINAAVGSSPTSFAAALQNQLNQILAQQGSSTTFTIDQTQAQQVFPTIAPTYEGKVDSAIT